MELQFAVQDVCVKEVTTVSELLCSVSTPSLSIDSDCLKP